ncbi:MAG: hypothetical protein O2919_01925 [Chloroflexi bacterium]|nr:hypothetical protein [Chloroflexota bacterium]
MTALLVRASWPGLFVIVAALLTVVAFVAFAPPPPPVGHRKNIWRRITRR